MQLKLEHFQPNILVLIIQFRRILKIDEGKGYLRRNLSKYIGYEQFLIYMHLGIFTLCLTTKEFNYPIKDLLRRKVYLLIPRKRVLYLETKRYMKRKKRDYRFNKKISIITSNNFCVCHRVNCNLKT